MQFYPVLYTFYMTENGCFRGHSAEEVSARSVMSLISSLRRAPPVFADFGLISEA